MGGGYIDAFGIKHNWLDGPEPTDQQKAQWAQERADYVMARVRAIILDNVRIEKFIETVYDFKGVPTLNVFLDPTKPEEFPSELIPDDLSRDAIRRCLGGDLEFFCEWDAEVAAWIPRGEWASIWQEKKQFCRKWSKIMVEGEWKNFPLINRNNDHWFAVVDGREIPVHHVDQKTRKYKPALGHWEMDTDTK